MVVTFSAQRSLLSGISANDSVTLGLLARYPGGVNRSRAVEANRRASQAGYRETWYVRGEVKWQITTIPLASSDQDAMRQFLDSVEDGQTFTFAPYDASGDSPIDYRNVVIDGDGYDESRESQNKNYSSFSFKLVEVP
jgi:hypothetical protein